MRDSSQSKRKLEGKRKLPFFLVHPDSPFQSLLNAWARLLNLTLSYWCNSYNDVSHRLSAWRSSYASEVFSGCSRHHGNRIYTCYNRSRQNLTCTSLQFLLKSALGQLWRSSPLWNSWKWLYALSHRRTIISRHSPRSPSLPHGALKPFGVGQHVLSLKLSRFTHSLGNWLSTHGNQRATK